MNFLNRMKEKKEKFKEFSEEQRMIEKFNERKKSANERELERFMKEEREDNIFLNPFNQPFFIPENELKKL